MADSPEAIKKHIKLYLLIGVILFICTVLTVAVAKLEFLDFGERGFDHVDATIGLIIATFKATLVALIFMHLNHEKTLIYWLFGFGLFFGFCLMALFGFAFADPIEFKAFFGR